MAGSSCNVGGATNTKPRGLEGTACNNRGTDSLENTGTQGLEGTTTNKRRKAVSETAVRLEKHKVMPNATMTEELKRNATQPKRLHILEYLRESISHDILFLSIILSFYTIYLPFHREDVSGEGN